MRREPKRKKNGRESREKDRVGKDMAGRRGRESEKEKERERKIKEKERKREKGRKEKREKYEIKRK